MSSMETLLEKANEASIAKAAELLKQGEIVAIPTETVYGIAASVVYGLVLVLLGGGGAG